MRLLGGVLAGGQSRRFGQPKAWALWQGRALIDHVVSVLAPQCSALVILGKTSLAPWPGLPDPGEDGPGAGIRSGLRAARQAGLDGLLSVPCDAPRLPADLAARLGAALVQGSAQIAVACGTRRHPTVALWPVGALAPLARAMMAGERRLTALQSACGPVAEVCWPEESLANINDRDALRHLG
jgi:molybdenum cofactor guanylyltransferase